MKVHSKFIKAFSVLLVAALLFAALPTDPVYAEAVDDRETVILSAADWIAANQNPDGGFPWILPSTTSSTNTLGVTAIGVLKGYGFEEKVIYQDSLAKAYDYVVNNPPVYTWDGSKFEDTGKGVDSFPDFTFLIWLAEIADTDSALLAAINNYQDPDIAASDIANLAKARWDDLVLYIGSAQETSPNGTATLMAQSIRDKRHSQNNDSLIPWDLGAGVKAALSLDGYFSGEGYLQQATDIAAVIYSSIDDGTYFSSTDTTQTDYVIGLTGAIEAFVEVGGYDTTVDDLKSKLLNVQQPDGSWKWHDATAPSDWSTQSTAYAIMALYAQGDQDALTAARKGADFLVKNQTSEGGWLAEEDWQEKVLEVDSEAAWALATLPAPVTNGDLGYYSIQSAIDSASDGDTIEVGPGTYTEQLVINKDLTLSGTGDPTITPPTSVDAYKLPESSASWEPVVLAFGGTADVSNAISGSETISFSMSGFVVDGADRVPSDRSSGILLRNVVGTVSGNTVQNMHVDGKETFGILAYGGSTVTIDSNTVSGYARGGITANGDDGTLVDPVAKITNNTVTGPGKDEDVTWAPNGIQIGRGATGTIEGNTVSENGWPGSAWTGSGIIIYGSDNVLVKDNETYNNETAIVTASANGTQIEGNDVHDSTYGIVTQTGSENTTIDGNTVQENTAGIFVSSGSITTTITNNIVTLNEVDGIDVYGGSEATYPTGTVIEYNQIFGNNTGDNEDSGGLWVLAGIPTVDASPNWWGSIAGPADDQIYGDVEFAPWCGDAECSFLVYPLEGSDATITINESKVYLLKDGAEFKPVGGPCFDITASNVTIMTESPGGAVCYPGSPGIQVVAGASNVVIEGLEIDGQGTAVGHGIHFLGAVSDVIISDTYIHGMDGDGVHFTAAPGGYVEITGNLFKDNFDFGVNAPTDIDVRYNAWGAYGGPTAGDGVSTVITNFSPWTHVDVYVEYKAASSRYANEVAYGETPAEEITYEVYANLQNAYGAEFTLTFDPAKLEVKSTSTSGTVFPNVWSSSSVAPGVTVDDTNGKITFAGGASSAVSGEGQFLFSVTFKGKTPTSDANPLSFDEADEDLFGMNPGYGASLNIYADELVGVADVNVYDLPTLAVDPLTNFAVGNPKEFTLKVTNPTTGRAYTNLNVKLTVPGGTTLEYWNGTEWAAYLGSVDIGALAVGDTADVAFRITFATSGNNTVTVDLYDGTIPLVTTDFGFTVLPSYTVTGSVQMQGRTERSGVLVEFSNNTLSEYVYDTLSTNVITSNFTLINVADGNYDISITHDRYLDFGYLSFNLDQNELDLSRLELRGGDVYKDNEIDISDASLVGGAYGDTGTPLSLGADANFDGRVNIQDLAMVGGNYQLTSSTAYSWSP